MTEKFANIDDIIFSFLRDEISVHERDTLKEWLSENPSNKEYFRQIYKIWNTIDLMKKDDKEVDKVLQKVKFQIQKPRAAVPEEVLSNPRNIGASFMKWAAILLIPLCTGAFLYSLFEKKTSSFSKTAYNEVSVPFGSKSKIHLPDGTEVTINAGSTLTYQLDYGKAKREVVLVGEAYFKVATNPKKPFIVKAKNIDVKAFGTEFNVKAYPDEDKVETTLVHGIVKIEGENDKREHFIIHMKPNQKITCFTAPKEQILNTSKNQIKQNQVIVQNPQIPQVQNDVKTDLYTSWKDNRWIIEGERFGDLAIILERKFNISIKFESEMLKDYRFTGTFQKETLEQVLQVLKLTAPITYEVGKGEVFIGINHSLQTKYDKYIN